MTLKKVTKGVFTQNTNFVSCDQICAVNTNGKASSCVTQPNFVLYNTKIMFHNVVFRVTDQVLLKCRYGTKFSFGTFEVKKRKPWYICRQLLIVLFYTVKQRLVKSRKNV
jgi:hypothetical protein